MASTRNPSSQATETRNQQATLVEGESSALVVAGNVERGSDARSLSSGEQEQCGLSYQRPSAEGQQDYHDMDKKTTADDNELSVLDLLRAIGLVDARPSRPATSPTFSAGTGSEGSPSMGRLVYVFRCICEWATSYFSSIWKLWCGFHSICGDAPEIENRSSSRDITEGVKLDQDYAMAMGKGAAMKELSNLPLSDLERHCRHNGLSLGGGREMMVARLLCLEENETEKSYEPDNEMRYGQLHSRSASHLKDASGRNISDIGDRDANHGIEPLMSSNGNVMGVDAKGLQGKSSRFLGPNVAYSTAEPKSLYIEKGKSDPVLPVSKWAREDDVVMKKIRGVPRVWH
ncbi:hypothetical protein IFM89_009653 [Coptis chinensis]|uniref:SAP domain-containing protein n=1 Tax=Coptis chinensis TaxID=261450 RepID=A0A835MDL5_9MAGN|nr:hypothetical protein IFM89_009653 [Coptis chinensis]